MSVNYNWLAEDREELQSSKELESILHVEAQKLKEVSLKSQEGEELTMELEMRDDCPAQNLGD